MLCCMAAAASAAVDYDTTARKAARFFEAREWASAQALYGLMLEDRPDADSVYVNAIVASSMLRQPEASSRLLSQAMEAGVSFSRLMDGVKTVSFAIGAPAVYEDFMIRSQRDCPWLSRAIDSELLGYYMFRDNGPMTIIYAEKMLAGLPDSVDYLSALAGAYASTGQFDKAVETWLKILDLSPDNYLTLLRLGNYYDISGDTSNARAYLSRADALRSTPYVASRLKALDAIEKKH